MRILGNKKINKISLIIILMIALILGCVGSKAVNNTVENNNLNNQIKNTTNNTTNNIIENNNTTETTDMKKSTKAKTSVEEKNMYVSYNSHVQDKGWEKDFSKVNGETSGTTGQNKKNEAIKIKLINAPANVGITYQTYIQNLGWQNWVKDGAIAGTTGRNLKMEAIKIKLEGTDKYSVEYRSHVQDRGWLNWMKDGEVSGIAGKGLKVEAVEIRIIPKTISVIYQSHIQDRGWKEYVNNGDTSGIAKAGLKIEGIRIELKNAKNVNILYQTHVQDKGWENTWKKNGQISGTTGQNKKIEAIKIKLDNIDYTVTYRTYVQNLGWQKWVKDGEVSGTTGKNLKVEAIEIKVSECKPSTEFTIQYRTHVRDIGWQTYVRAGDTAGTTGRNKAVEAINIVGKNIPKGVTIEYQTHIQDLGWENTWKKNGEQSGTTGKAKKVEAIKIRLTGTEEYSIMYRTHITNKGWQNWANDGEISGTTGKNLAVEAIEIKIVPKIKNKIKVSVEKKLPSTVGQSEYSIKGWLMTDINKVKIQVLIDDKLSNAIITREKRNDVLESIKGYGGQDKNPTPGFNIKINFKDISLGNRNIKIQFIDEKGKVLTQETMTTNVKKIIPQSSGTYGKTGLKVAGRGGDTLKYLKYGSGPNVFFATFAIHGYEDLWNKDGYELINIAEKFYNRLVSDQDYAIADKWTIYVFPGINLDGLSNGYTNNGPGRTTLFSQAPNNKGIDLNRCWQVGNSYTRYTDSRNYNGTTGFQAYEAQALRDFLLANKSKTGQTVLVDLHGWTQQLIGDPSICAYYEKQFPENDKSAVGRYGTGYLVNWARSYLGSNGKVAKSALIELPHQGVTGTQSVYNKNLINRYIEATLSMLKSIV